MPKAVANVRIALSPNKHHQILRQTSIEPSNRYNPRTLRLLPRLRLSTLHFQSAGLFIPSSKSSAPHPSALLPSLLDNPHPDLRSRRKLSTTSPTMFARTLLLPLRARLFAAPSPINQTPMRTFTSLLAASARPTLSQTTISTQIRGMKVRSSVKKLCDGCKVCHHS